MIHACPICGSESGVTHGDQHFTREICSECIADELLMDWYVKRRQESVAKEAEEGQKRHAHHYGT